MLLAGDYSEHLGTGPFSYHSSLPLRNQAVEDQRLLHGAFTWSQMELGCLGLQLPLQAQKHSQVLNMDSENSPT